MPPAPPRRRSTVEQPGRLAAVGGAAAVCLLTVSGALGIFPSGGGAAADPRVAPPQASGGMSHGGPLSASDQPEAGTTTSAAGGGADTAPPNPTSTPPSTAPGGGGADLPPGSGTGRRVIFDSARQRVWLVKADGNVARTYPVSGSTYDNLSPGTYHVYSRSLHARSFNSNETMRYMVRFATGRVAPIGFHSIPVFPDGRLAEPRSQLGTARSNGCIRQWITDARVLWDFAPVGTEVVVLA